MWKLQLDKVQKYDCKYFNKCGVLHDLVPFVQFKKREKYPWRVLIAKACNFTKIKTPLWVFFTLFKLYKWYQIAQRITLGCL